MKFTLGWLKEHLDTDADLETISERLSMIGLEVEEIADRAADFQGFVVAHVVEARQHPNADRLKVCIVDNGAEQVQVVCGAPNARTGMKGVFAPSGSHIPGTGIDLKPSKIRGEDSNGMLLSERELGLSDDHDGIVDLPDDAPLGGSYAEWAGLDDPVIEIAITPNRADCLGVRGIARDLAAAGLGTLKPDPVAATDGGFDSPVAWQLDFPADAADACPFIVGRTIKGVTNGPSPAWMQDRLRAIGLRPISALVDITNYVAYDRGRPLHVYDVDKLSGDLTVRFAKAGESFAALNDKSYKIDAAAADSGVIAITDASGLLGLGGIVGGESSGADETTTTVFIESALFDPIRIAAAGRRLQIDSDARYRFERGVDPNTALHGMHQATQLVLDLCGGEASTIVTAGAQPAFERKIAFDPARVRALGGIDIDDGAVADILEALGFVSGPEVAVPSWRGDVHGPADLVEEVMRIHGYDRIPETPMPRPARLPDPSRDPAQRRAARARRSLASRGLVEAVTNSFMKGDHAALFGGVPEAIRLDNPISTDLDTMRPSILPNLVAAAGRNADRGFPDLALFEVGPQFAGDAPEEQALVAAGVRAGNSGPRHWSDPPRPVDAFDAKADALAVLADLGAPVAKLQTKAEAPAWYHPGRSGTLGLGPNVLARFGELHPGVLRAMDVDGPLAGFEVFLDAIPEPRRKGGARGLTLSPFQPVERDFAFLLDADVAAETVVRAARGADRDLVDDVSVFDLYAGAPIAEGQKSLAISVTLQPRKATLTDEEIEAVSLRIVAAVEKATGGTLRG